KKSGQVRASRDILTNRPAKCDTRHILIVWFFSPPIDTLTDARLPKCCANLLKRTNFSCRSSPAVHAPRRRPAQCPFGVS
ncbi:TPA: hypothetical protein ACKP2D_004642, partial [Serratia marcescens]